MSIELGPSETIDISNPTPPGPQARRTPSRPRSQHAEGDPGILDTPSKDLHRVLALSNPSQSTSISWRKLRLKCPHWPHSPEQGDAPRAN
ncbi:hypothetical protein GB937_004084 [Aspergillus fischeri]|nr:hypothetical protein GB937_004084 [Aspergillus fischeri]